jgi:hypothetical protein
MLNITKIRPMANYLVTTKDEYTEDDVKKGGLMIKTVGSLKEYQKVVAVGPMVRGIQVGDLVCINPKRYAQYKHKPGSLKDGVITDNPVVSYNFNVIELDHISHLLLTDQDIDFVIEEWNDEKEPEKSNIIIPERKIIV